MNVSESENSVRFSSENWKVLQKFKEEKHKLELSRETILDDTALSTPGFRKRLLEDSDYIQDSVRDENADFNENIESTLHDTMKSENLENKKLFSPSQYISSSIKEGSDDRISPTNEKGVNPLPIEKYCRLSLCGSPKETSERINSNIEYGSGMQTNSRSSMHSEKLHAILEEYSFQTSSGDSLGVKEVPQKIVKEQSYMTPAIKSMAVILFRIPKLRDFITVVLSELSNSVIDYNKKFPTLSFFIDVGAEKNGSSTRLSDSSETFEESISMLLLTTLEIFHEELTQAKAEHMLKYSCHPECKYLQKKNHSIVSHLFRGYFTKKVSCMCGYGRQIQQAFTDVPITSEKFSKKTIIIRYVSMNGNDGKSLKITRFLIEISNWSTLSDLNDMLRTTLQQQNRNALKENSKIAFFASVNDRPKILDENSKVYQLIHEDIDTLSASDVMLGAHAHVMTPSNAHVTPNNNSDCSKSIPLSSHQNKERILTSSTPVFFEAASSSMMESFPTMELIKLKENTKVCRVSALVSMQLIWLAEKCDNLSLTLELPKICNGLYLFERINRIIGIGTGEDKENGVELIVTVVNKTGVCIFCLNKNCAGCPMQHSDRVLLSQHYFICGKFYRGIFPKSIETTDDKSLIKNSPVTILTLNECLTSYAEQEESHCPICFEKKDWKANEIFMKKLPDVLIIHFPNNLREKDWLHFPQRNFRPLIGKRRSKFNYNLVCLTTTDDDGRVYLRGSQGKWMMRYCDSNLPVNDVPTFKIGMLMYLKDEKICCTQSHSKIKQRISKKMTGGSTKYSTRGCRLRKPHNLTSKDYFSETSSYMTEGTFTTLQSDGDSTCRCLKCQTLGRVHSQIIQNRSEVVIDNIQSRRESHGCSFHYARSQHSHRSDISIKSAHSIVASSDAFALEKKLHKSIRNQNLKDVMKFLKEGADINYLLNGTGALHLVAAMPTPFGAMFTKLFLEHGADPNLQACDGFTPVHVATMWSREETLSLLLQHGGLPHIKDAEGKSAFEFLLKSGNNSEKLLRILRTEECIVKKYNTCNNNNSNSNSNNNNNSNKNLNFQPEILQNGAVDNIALLNISGNSCKGERTFDDIFHCNDVKKLPSLNESIVSQHLTSLENSDISYNGSVKHSLWSLLLCSGKCSKVRRRKGEERWITRVVRQRISKWIDEIFSNRD